MTGIDEVRFLWFVSAARGKEKLGQKARDCPPTLGNGRHYPGGIIQIAIHLSLPHLL